MGGEPHTCFGVTRPPQSADHSHRHRRINRRRTRLYYKMTTRDCYNLRTLAGISALVSKLIMSIRGCCRNRRSCRLAGRSATLLDPERIQFRVPEFENQAQVVAVREGQVCRLLPGHSASRRVLHEGGLRRPGRKRRAAPNRPTGWRHAQPLILAVSTSTC